MAVLLKQHMEAASPPSACQSHISFGVPHLREPAADTAECRDCGLVKTECRCIQNEHFSPTLKKYWENRMPSNITPFFMNWQDHENERITHIPGKCVVLGRPHVRGSRLIVEAHLWTREDLQGQGLMKRMLPIAMTNLLNHFQDKNVTKNSSSTVQLQFDIAATADEKIILSVIQEAANAAGAGLEVRSIGNQIITVG